MAEQISTIPGNTIRGSAQKKDAGPRPPVLHIETYLPLLEGMDISEDDKTEILEMLWKILCHFVDMGFGVDSISLLFPELFGNPCETQSCEIVGDTVKSKYIPDTNKNILAADYSVEKLDSK